MRRMLAARRAPGQQVGAVRAGHQAGHGLAAGEQAVEVVVGAGGKHGGEDVVAGALGAQLHAQALGEEGQDFIRVGAGRLGLGGGGDQRAQGQAQAGSRAGCG